MKKSIFLVVVIVAGQALFYGAIIACMIKYLFS